MHRLINALPSPFSLLLGGREIYYVLTLNPRAIVDYNN